MSTPPQAQPIAGHTLQDRVVLQFGNRSVRGFADVARWEDSLRRATEPARTLLFQPIEAGPLQEVSLQGIKAVFFVKHFEGPGLDDLRFHDHLQPLENIWVRVTFHDGEIIEGLISNKADHVLQPGFFMKPTDPNANHWLIYVSKYQVCEFQVLGLRAFHEK